MKTASSRLKRGLFLMCYNQRMNSPGNIEETRQKVLKVTELVYKQSLGRAAIVGLYGDLGSGKTTFTQILGEVFGVKEKILSPTFVIEKIYKIHNNRFEHLIHIDAYRIEDPNELKVLGWETIASNPKNLICVEWADKISNLLPEDHIRVRFSHAGEHMRIVEVVNK